MRSALILIALAPALGGCVASLAASAVGAAAQAARGEPRVVTEDLRSSATEACRARAGIGTIRVIDVEQRTDGRVTVWGTVETAEQRRSFECVHSGGRITAFRLREIRTH